MIGTFETLKLNISPLIEVPVKVARFFISTLASSKKPVILSDGLIGDLDNQGSPVLYNTNPSTCIHPYTQSHSTNSGVIDNHYFSVYFHCFIEVDW